MRFVFYVLPALILLPAGIYLFILCGRFLTLFHVRRKTAVSRTISVLFAVLCIVSARNVFRLGAVIVLYFIGACLVTEVVYGLFKKRLSQDAKAAGISNFLYRSQIISVVVVVLALVYGFYNMQQVSMTSYKISSEKSAGLTIAAITDLHLGTTMDVNKLREVCGEIEAQKPDILVLVGDIFDEHTTREEMIQGTKALGGLKSTYGSFYVLGNHDPNKYVESPAYTKEELTETLEASGVQVLEDEAVLVGDFYVIGRRDASDMARRELREITDHLEPGAFKLILDHQPGQLSENVEAGMDLQISGHTHAGQIWPTGWLMELLGINEINYGYRKVENLQVIVSSGIAGWGYPIRTGGKCEYLTIDIVLDF